MCGIKFWTMRLCVQHQLLNNVNTVNYAIVYLAIIVCIDYVPSLIQCFIIILVNVFCDFSSAE